MVHLLPRPATLLVMATFFVVEASLIRRVEINGSHGHDVEETSNCRGSTRVEPDPAYPHTLLFKSKKSVESRPPGQLGVYTLQVTLVVILAPDKVASTKRADGFTVTGVEPCAR